MVATTLDPMAGLKMGSLSLKDNTTVELVLLTPSEDISWIKLIDVCCIQACKLQASTVRLPLDNGNTKLVLPKESNVETICG